VIPEIRIDRIGLEAEEVGQNGGIADEMDVVAAPRSPEKANAARMGACES
jgi:hypothetical protein